MRRSMGAPMARGANRSKGASAPNRPTTKAQQQQDVVAAAIDALDEALIFDDEEGGTRIGDIYIPPPVPAHCSMESVGPRLIIKRIVNYNFKSYAGEVSLGPFHHSFTAIIGPNGSGKSNVIDSMMFVFGCRANRIRCKKLSTLIHNSKYFPDLKSCSVAVHFELVVDQPDGICTKQPNSEFVVSRTANADNTSFYQIDKQRVQLKDVAKLLKKHHVDLEHNRFLILQGEVESISMMKPMGAGENETGMLEYLEDIIGTQRYIRPLQQINQRVDQLSDDRIEKLNRCKLAEREMKDLEQPYNEAVEYLRMENEHTRNMNIIAQKYIRIKQQLLDDLTKKHETCAAELQKHDEGTNALKKERAEKELIIRKEIEAYEALIKQREAIKKELVGADRSYTEVQSAMENTNKQRKKDKAQIDKNEKELDELHKLPAKNEKEIEECEHKMERLEQEKVTLSEEREKQLTLFNEKSAPLTEKRLKYSDELIGHKEAANEARETLHVHESKMKILKQVEVTETRKYQTLKSAYEEAQESQQQMTTKLQELNENMPQLDEEIAIKTAEIEKLTKDERNMSTQRTKLREEINERSTNMQAQRSNNNVLNFLMRMKMEGKIPGILGRLGDLGGIDAKYDVAISTACSRLDNIVTDNYDTATAAIKALKEHNVGRAQFIPLNRMEHFRSKSYPIDTPENVPRLYDLVQVEDERVKTAFYMALQNTLVANDLEQGSRIAYGQQRYRVVTLSGDIIEQAGTMTGGGNKPLRGKMGTQVRTKTAESADTSMVSQQALQQMQVQADELQQRISYCQEQQGRLEHEIQTLKANRQRSESEQKRLTVSIKSHGQQMASSLKQCEAQRQRMLSHTTDEAAVRELELRIEETQKLLTDRQATEQSVDDKLKEIQDQFEVLRSDTVKPVEARLKKVTTQIEKLSSHVRSLNVALSTAERNIERLKNNNANLQENIKTAEDKLRALNEERQQCQERKNELEKQASEAEEAIGTAKSQSSDVKKEIDALNKQENDRNIKRLELETNLQAVASSVDKVNAEIPYWKEQLKPLKLNVIPGDTEQESAAPLKTHTPEELEALNLAEIQYKQTSLEEQLKTKPNLGYIQEFMEKQLVYMDRVRFLEDISSKRNEMRDKYEEVRKRRYTEFMEGFNIITRKLKEMYRMITQGGDADLELVDSMDPFHDGVQFTVRPPKKSWKYISNLSGGEKTLSSLALVFALHYYKPSPLYFMDEIDAALDFKNVSIVGHYIKERTKNAQFIIVSLRVNMFELSNYLVGIYKINDCTDSCTILNYPINLLLPSASQLRKTSIMPKDMMIGTCLNGDIQTFLTQHMELSRLIFAPPLDSTAMSKAD
ncbi:structural maintenance of chromosomes protein 4 isoform X2 [Drosophila grimshawi]|uniref:Structural maintenance of chromosomes protein n=1 Tax=Drosophila grimshawi TaxID=7222 RepID=B4JBI8_DROGR|nr:structural maintenance of chromosomes protein 4 isoform X2 [Drosophila grimshawi]EDW04011.1 GH10207 [Drosophila grimshawi]